MNMTQTQLDEIISILKSYRNSRTEHIINKIKTDGIYFVSMNDLEMICDILTEEKKFALHEAVFGVRVVKTIKGD